MYFPVYLFFLYMTANQTKQPVQAVRFTIEGPLVCSRIVSQYCDGRGGGLFVVGLGWLVVAPMVGGR